MCKNRAGRTKMHLKNLYGIAIITLLSFICGCSSQIPLLPCNSEPSISRTLLGLWALDVNPNSMSARIEPMREAFAHFKVTSYLPTPSIKVNSWDSSTETLDVDVTIVNENYLHVYGYDVRLIIYSDNIGHKLINADDYTGLFDIAGGAEINPFKAYAKGVANRKLAWKASQTENLQIKCPGANFQVKFAIDASYPSNCAEPYMIDGFNQGSELYDVEGATSELSVKVLDWQNDVDTVKLLCPQITGESETPFIFDSGTFWKLNIVNNSAAPVGLYDAIIKATSSGSGTTALFDVVTIVVSEKPLRGFGFPVAYPTASGYSLTEYDGRKWMDYLNPYGYHLGDDWTKIGGGDNDCGDPVYAVGDGVVTYAQDYLGVWGNIVMIKHDNIDNTGTMTSYYAHLTEMYVQVGDPITAGQVIGTIGDNHGHYYCHLHFEIRNGNSTQVGVAFTPTIVTEGPYGQIDPSKFINDHYNP